MMLCCSVAVRVTVVNSLSAFCLCVCGGLKLKVLFASRFSLAGFANFPKPYLPECQPEALSRNSDSKTPVGEESYR